MSAHVTLAVPARNRYGRVARQAAAALAADVGLDVDDIEDLRVAVNELFALLVEGAESDDDRIDITFSVADDSLTATGERPVSAQERTPDPDDLALQILSVIVDEHDFTADDSHRSFRLVKRTAQR